MNRARRLNVDATSQGQRSSFIPDMNQPHVGAPDLTPANEGMWAGLTRRFDVKPGRLKSAMEQAPLTRKMR